MENIVVRRYVDGDETAICEIVKKAVLSENIKDYSKIAIDHLVESHNADLIKRRAKAFHVYVLTDEDKIIGVGMIGPYWDSLTESSFFTIFLDPQYKGTGLGRKIIETLEADEYFTRAERVEIPASITAVEFYRHFGYGFKKEKLGHIVDGEGIYRMEKFPKLSNDNSNRSQYNMRPYIDNEYHDYKEFIYQTKKNAYKQYVEANWGTWNEDDQRRYYDHFIDAVADDAWIIQMNGKDIGFYNGLTLEDGSYEIGNICIIPEYQGKGIGTQVLKDIMELHKGQDLHIQYFKQNPVGKLYERLGFQPNGETEFHYQMFKPKEEVLKK
ncbi:MAG: GNAT family N-acetyltransferase [Bacilli bacterium]|nr:GNAT family N-acetyltransferase [Bacilli bacterium]